jgi:regulator of PEP synthase PpsR (kinase-PPPase family)
MMHDDGQVVDNLENADVVLVGVSRTSKTPTSIYLANRGVKTANVPLIPGMAIPPHLDNLKRSLVVGLFASPERIVQIRENRILSLNATQDRSSYVDRAAVAEEIASSRRYFAERGWPMIDVTRRSIEETAAAILSLLNTHRRELAERDGS